MDAKYKDFMMYLLYDNRYKFDDLKRPDMECKYYEPSQFVSDYSLQESFDGDQDLWSHLKVFFSPSSVLSDDERSMIYEYSRALVRLVKEIEFSHSGLSDEIKYKANNMIRDIEEKILADEYL